MTGIPADVAGRIRLVILDSDGVMTDGGIYTSVDAEGRSFGMRRFHVQDGIAVFLLRRAGVRVAIVSGKLSPALDARGRELGIDDVFTVDARDKLATVAGLLVRDGIEWSEVACLGDDLADLPLLERVGLPGAVANAVPEVRAAAAWHGQRAGGDGAVREFAEALLRVDGRWTDLLEAYLSECRDRAAVVEEELGGPESPR